MPSFVQKDPEEGSPCKKFFCTGHYNIMHPEGFCQCAITKPPCNWCINTFLRCDKCEDEVHATDR